MGGRKMELDWVDSLVFGVDVDMNTPIYALDLSERALLDMLKGREFYVKLSHIDGAILAIRKERDNA